MRTQPFLLGSVAALAMVLVSVSSCSSGGDGDEEVPVDNPDLPQDLQNTKEITPQGGSISIYDAFGNRIEVSFPPEALVEPIDFSLNVIDPPPDLPIETQDVSPFEVSPRDALLYEPVSIFVEYKNPVQDLGFRTIFRRRTDSQLIPLADHETLGPKLIRAQAFILGEFAEGAMSADQIQDQLALLQDFKQGGGPRLLALELEDPTCYTHITKSIWDDWKETAFGEHRYYEELQWLGVDVDGELWDSICTETATKGAQLVLGRCIPKDLCDHNYRYAVFDALNTIQRLACIQDSEAYNDLNGRYEDIVAECSRDGYLEIQLSAREVHSQIDGPVTPYYGEVTYGVHARIPIKIEILNAVGFAEVREERTAVLKVNGSGEIYYHPATVYERRCDVSTSGHILVHVAGRKSSTGVYALSILTSHYISRMETCPGDIITQTPLDHEKSRVFDVSLDSKNDFTQRVKANGDDQWTVNVELVTQP